MASSSSTISPQPKYDVFLSFRGEDTRDNFTSHLCEALRGGKIETFMDNRLKRGERISSALLKAIRESKVSIVVFSENYASSSWCLDELVQIRECMENNGQFVMPVFYKVDPSHVRKQEGPYAKAFSSRKRWFWTTPPRVREWKDALSGVASLSGWDSKNWSDEAALIKAIVEDIRKKLKNSSPSHEAKGLVGIEARVKRIEDSLRLGENGVRIVGIWGMGGIGKTTLARVVVERLSSQFEECVFLASVREAVERKGVDRFLQKIESDENSYFAKDEYCLRRHKVLVVFDDVHYSDKLLNYIEKLKGMVGVGSRIIVTTRDCHVLRELLRLPAGHREFLRYKAMELNRDEALDLFHLNSKIGNHGDEMYRLSAETVIECAQGNPLAVKVLAKSLNRAADKAELESALSKIKTLDSKEIDDVLKVSYDLLDDEEKEMFLDLACFFNGMQKCEVERALQGLGYYAGIGLRVLTDNSLISLDSNLLQMHDMIQAMGRKIVTKQFSTTEEPGTWSRLWNAKDVQHVLQENTGTASIKGISLDVSTIDKEIHVTPEAFSKMCYLRFLKIHGEKRNVYLPVGLHNLPSSLRYLYWEGYPLKSLHMNIADSLVDLLMPKNQVEYLWNGVQHLPTLKRIDLNHSQRLIQIPDLSNAPNVEFINIECCTSLIQHPSLDSLQHLQRLGHLRIGFCEDIVNLRRRFIVFSSVLRPYHSGFCSTINYHLDHHYQLSSGSSLSESSRSSKFDKFIELETRNSGKGDIIHCHIEILRLKYDYISKCLPIHNLPELPRNIQELYLNGAAIKEVPSSIERLSSLQILDLTNCKELHTLPISICKLKSLQVLSLYGCSEFQTFPEIFEPMGCLTLIYLDGTAIQSLPISIYLIWNLQKLSLTMCEQLQFVPYSLYWLVSLGTVGFGGSRKIGGFPCPLSPHLRYLDLSDCDLSEIPDHVFTCLITIQLLWLSGNLFESIPESIKQLVRLRYLNVSNCTRLKSLPSLPSGLQQLYAVNCISMETVPRFNLDIGQFEKNYSAWSNVSIFFTDCPRMDQNAIDNIAAHAKILFQTFAKSFSVVRSTICIYQGNQIPAWFEYCTENSSKLDVKLCRDWFDTGFSGFAFSVVFDLKGYQDRIFECEFLFKCKFISQEGRELHDTTPLRLFYFSDWKHESKKGICPSDHVLIRYVSFPFCKQLIRNGEDKLREDVSFELLPYMGKPDCNIKKFGICPIYAKNT